MALASLLSFRGDSDEALRQICAALRVKPFVAEHAELESCAKPEEYRGFPYTDRPDRLVSLCRVLSGAAVCPVVFEMLEQLKASCHFKVYGR